MTFLSKGKRQPLDVRPDAAHEMVMNSVKTNSCLSGDQMKAIFSPVMNSINFVSSTTANL